MQVNVWFAFFCAFNALLLVALSLNVSRLRLKHHVSLGDGGVEELQFAIRTHANGVEQVPIFGLLLLGLLLIQVAPSILAGFIIVFTLARISHALGMLGGISMARKVGAGFTFLCQLSAAGSLFIYSLY